MASERRCVELSEEAATEERKHLRVQQQQQWWQQRQQQERALGQGKGARVRSVEGACRAGDEIRPGPPRRAQWLLARSRDQRWTRSAESSRAGQARTGQGSAKGAACAQRTDAQALAVQERAASSAALCCLLEKGAPATRGVAILRLHHVHSREKTMVAAGPTPNGLLD